MASDIVCDDRLRRRPLLAVTTFTFFGEVYRTTANQTSNKNELSHQYCCLLLENKQTTKSCAAK